MNGKIYTLTAHLERKPFGEPRKFADKQDAINAAGELFDAHYSREEQKIAWDDPAELTKTNRLSDAIETAKYRFDVPEYWNVGVCHALAYDFQVTLAESVPHTIADLDGIPEYLLVTDSQDLDALREDFPRLEMDDSAFVLNTEDGDQFVYAFSGTIPYLYKRLWRILPGKEQVK